MYDNVWWLIHKIFHHKLFVLDIFSRHCSFINDKLKMSDDTLLDASTIED
jgi:hypothetical protein